MRPALFSYRSSVWLNKWTEFRDSFWFLPLVLNLTAVVLGLMIPYLESRIELGKVDSLEWMLSTAGSARSILAALAGALITETTMIFSVTMVSLSMTVSQYGSQPLRTFMTRSVSQLTLGMFLGTSIYCLLVLFWVQEGGGVTFVPHLSVVFALVLTVVNHLLFIYFLHQVATSLQSNVVAKSIADDLSRTIERLYQGEARSKPGQDIRSVEEFEAILSEQPYQSVIRSQIEGYLQVLDLDALLTIARHENVVFRLHTMPGDFLRVGADLASVYSEEQFDQSRMGDYFRQTLVLGSRRTPNQDVESAVWELVEVAVRALSPGINDPVTAMICINYLGANLVRLLNCLPVEARRFDEHGQLRLIVPTVKFADVVDVGFSQIELYGRDNPTILLRLLDQMGLMLSQAKREEHLSVLVRHIEQIQRTSESTLAYHPHAIELIRERAQKALKHRG